jgi:hypothetical protein
MNRAFARTMVFFAISVALVACGSDSSNIDYGGSTGYSASCSAFASCGACTPQNGCGWCYNSDGTGQCAPSPDECVTPSFEWTWNPSGCRVPAMATPNATADGGEAPEASTVAPLDGSAE